jgi:hypothetical protein
VLPAVCLEIDKSLPRMLPPGPQVTTSVPIEHDNHERYKKLVGTYVIVGGERNDKGFYAQIQDYLGNYRFRVAHRSESRLLEVHVNYLLLA